MWHRHDERVRPRPEILLPQTLTDSEIETLADYVESLRKREAHGLGFIPASSYPAAMKRGRLFVEMENDEPCGFCMWAQRKKVLRIHQTAVQEDARRIKHGTSIVAQVVNAATVLHATTMRLRVADDLEANHFWKAIGCKIVRVAPGGKTWGRMINVYEASIAKPLAVAERLIAANLAADHAPLRRPRTIYGPDGRPLLHDPH